MNKTALTVLASLLGVGVLIVVFMGGREEKKPEPVPVKAQVTAEKKQKEVSFPVPTDRPMTIQEAARLYGASEEEPAAEDAEIDRTEYIYVNGKRIKKENRPEAALIYLEEPENHDPNAAPFNPFELSDEQKKSAASAANVPFIPGVSAARRAAPDEAAAPSAAAPDNPLDEEQTEDVSRDASQEPQTTDDILEALMETNDRLAFDLIFGVVESRRKGSVNSMNLAKTTVKALGDIGSEESTPWLKRELERSLQLDPTLEYGSLVIQALDKLDQAEGNQAIRDYADMLASDPYYLEKYPEKIAEARALAQPSM